MVRWSLSLQDELSAVVKSMVLLNLIGGERLPVERFDEETLYFVESGQLSSVGAEERSEM
jgi:hypothetical protein